MFTLNILEIVILFFDLPPFFLSFKSLLKKENIIIVHFNWSPGNRFVMAAHPEVKRVFHWGGLGAVVNGNGSSPYHIRVWRLNIMCQ